jgi:hypothetical protein
MQKLEQVTWPKPNAEFIYATFAMFAEKHPWVAGGGNRGGEGKDQNIRPKGVARALYEDASDFRDFVKRMELGRLEGALLRYLAQVHDTLARSVPERLRDEETEEMIGYLRAMIASVDTSLLEAWERLVAPAAPAEREAEPARPAYDLANDPPALRARIRGELQALVRDLANRRYADAVTRLHPDTRLDAESLEAALAPFYAEHERIVYDPRARQAHRCVISEARPRVYRFAQGLIDEADENTFSLFGQVDLCDEPNPAHPLIRLERVSE